MGCLQILSVKLSAGHIHLKPHNPHNLIPGSGQFCSPDISGIKEDIAIIQSTLEQKLTEGRNISTELDRAKKEKKSLQAENMRLNHR